MSSTRVGVARTFRRRSRAAVVFGLLVALTVFGAVGAARPAAASVITVHGVLGVDSCTLPSKSVLEKWWKSTTYGWWGVYIGGSTAEAADCGIAGYDWVHNTLLASTSTWLIEPIWDGPQPPCYSDASHHFSLDPGTANTQGVEEAAAAHQALLSSGFGTDSTVAYDIEGLDVNNSACVAATKAFIQGWTTYLADPPAQVSGVYGGGCGSDLVAFSTIAIPPNYINGGGWGDGPNTASIPCVPAGDWDQHQRLKQYVNGHHETHGGISFGPVDNDNADGPLSDVF